MEQQQQAAPLATVEVETGPEPHAAVIWLHGLGADGHDFEPAVPALVPALGAATETRGYDTYGRVAAQNRTIPGDMPAMATTFSTVVREGPWICRAEMHASMRRFR